MLILAIETSCDETSVALFGDALIGQVIRSQIKLHRPYGGVVPEIASRDHIKSLLPLIHGLLHEHEYSLSEVTHVAYTAGPGLAGALLSGASVALGVAASLGIPAVPVHHIEGHILSPLIGDHPVAFPYLAVLFSGGHSLLVWVASFREYHVLGESIDDAMGECLDKMAIMMGLPYPGGPEIEKCALNGDATRFDLPQPMRSKEHCNMSFSGLKTAVMNLWQSLEQTQQDVCDMSASLQKVCAQVMLNKVAVASSQHPVKQVVLVGGVSANQYLREELALFCGKHGIDVGYPDVSMRTDNAGMIALTAAMMIKEGHHYQFESIKPRWSLRSLPKIA